MMISNRPFSNYDSLVESATFVLFEFAEPTIKKLVDKFAEEADEAQVREYLTAFERFKASLAKKDPFQYKTFQELEQAVDAAKGKSEFKKKKKKVDTNVDAAEAIADDSDVQIFKGDSEHKCVKYGNGYSFCISRPGGGNMFSNYRLAKASTFYFIFFKKVSKDDPRHIMVLDRTAKGWEWTFANNSTQDTTWEEIVSQFPALKKHERLFGNNPLDDEEKDTHKQVRWFVNRNGDEGDWDNIPYARRSAMVKSGITIKDALFDKLDSALRNDYISVGTNLSPHQVESLKPNEIARYKRVRAQTWKPLLADDKLEINAIDQESAWFHGEAQTHNHDNALKILERARLNQNEELKIGGSINLGGLNLFSLPKEFKGITVYGDFNIVGGHITTLENFPKEIVRGFMLHSLPVKSLEGGPTSVGGNYNLDCLHQLESLNGCAKSVYEMTIRECSNLKSLIGAPTKIEKFTLDSCHRVKNFRGLPPRLPSIDVSTCAGIETLEGSPKKVHDFFVVGCNNLISLRGGPKMVDHVYAVTYASKLSDATHLPDEVGGYATLYATEITRDMVAHIDYDILL